MLLCFGIPEVTSHENGPTTTPESNPKFRHIAELLLYFILIPSLLLHKVQDGERVSCYAPWRIGRETLNAKGPDDDRRLHLTALIKGKKSTAASDMMHRASVSSRGTAEHSVSITLCAVF